MNEADQFIYCLPCMEEDMLAVARATVRADKSRAHYMSVIERLEQTAAVMREYLERHDAKKANET